MINIRRSASLGAFLLLGFAESRPPVVRGIDHFFATSPNTEPFYRFFRDSLGLTEVYPFRDYGDFASGIVSMGNVLFEVVRWDVPAGETLPSELKGIALEPNGTLTETVARLREYGVPHEKPDSVNMTSSAGVKALAYVNIGLDGLDGPGGLEPAMAAIFINDNLGSPRAVTRRKEGAEELVGRNGGALGVLAVRELVLGVEDLEAALAQWRKLLGDEPREQGGVVTWPVGPAMRFVKAPRASIIEMVLQVRSLARARQFLEPRGMIAEEDRRLCVKPEAVEGLRICVVE